MPCMYGKVVKIKHFVYVPGCAFETYKVQSLLITRYTHGGRNWYLVLAVDEKNYGLTHQSPDMVQPPMITVRRWHKKFSCLDFYHSRISSSRGIKFH